MEDSVFRITDIEQGFRKRMYLAIAIGGIYADFSGIGPVRLKDRDIVRKATEEEILTFEVITK